MRSKMEEYIRRQEFDELRGRVTLIEGGCTDVLATKDDLKGLDVLSLKTDDEYVSKETFNKLIDYLSKWIRAGNLSMRDLPTIINNS